MATEQENNKRIAKNTMLLYVRMLFTMCVGLFTSRVILNALGVVDYGIYNVVGGAVAMFSVISGSLNAAISRYITYELGTGNIFQLKKIFSSAVTIQLVLATVILVLAETIGLWFLNTQMVIPENRMSAAIWAYQFSLIAFVINLISVPYNAAIISHEKMSAFAYISIVDVVGKLLIAYGVYVSPIDTLVFYAAMMVVLSSFIRFIYGQYCRKHFDECNFTFLWDKELLKKMFGFAGWNFIGASSAVLRDQGGTILINLFFGPSVNAARGISMHVNSAVIGFVNNFQTALNPQITKNYASGNRDYMMFLLFQGARLSFFIMLILSVPIIVTTPYLLKLWLGQVPEHSVNFVRLVLVFSLSETLAGPLVTAMLATGNIKKYQIIVGGLQLMNIPVSLFFLHLNSNAEIVLIVAIVISVCCELARLLLLRKMIGLQVRRFFSEVYFKVLFVALLSFAFPYFVYRNIDMNFVSFILLCVISVLNTLCVLYLVGLNYQDKEVCRKIAGKFVNRIKKK